MRFLSLCLKQSPDSFSRHAWSPELRVDAPGVESEKGQLGLGGEVQSLPPHSFLSVVGTWYVTAIVIIKYIWSDKEMTPGDILTRWVRARGRHLMENLLPGPPKVRVKHPKATQLLASRLFSSAGLGSPVTAGRRQDVPASSR